MIVDGKEVLFLRDDGAPAEGAVYEGGVDKEGELVFFELMGIGRHLILDEKEKYVRLLIRRVFPYLKTEENEKEITRT